MTDDRAFIDAILAAPDDTALRLVYADWLEERGDLRAEFLRLDVEARRGGGVPHRRVRKLRARLRELRPEISRDWLAFLDRTRVEGCGSIGCRMRWELLRTTDESHLRVCQDCHKKVFYCSSVEHAQRHTNFGHRVAVDSRVPRTGHDLYVNPFRDPDSPTDWETRPTPPAPRFHIGQAVTFRAGAYRGSEGRIERLSLTALRAAVVMDRPLDEDPPMRLVVEVDFEDLNPR